ncbi:MAG TPA: hypothetical protein VGC90_07800 [Candidatus Limnocylindrales bacterium]|jgi:hypothetical protein
MEGLAFIVMLLLAFVLFDIVAVVFGAESRESFIDPREPFRPTGIISR